MVEQTLLSRRRFLAVAIAIALALLLLGIVLMATRDPARDLWNEAAGQLALGHKDEAEALLQLLIDDHPRSRYAAQARAVLGGAASPGAPDRPMTPAERLFRQAQNFYPLGGRTRADIREAARRYLAVADGFPEDPLAADALYEAAQCLDQVDDYAGACVAWQRLLVNYPRDARAPEALYALAYINIMEMNRPEEGRRYLAELEAKYPGSNAAEAARQNFAKADPRATTTAPDERPTIHTTPGGK